MGCNKDEAARAKEIAEKKLEKNNFEGARKISLKAQNLYPELENITQMLAICNVHCAAKNEIWGFEKEWYRILDLDIEKLADEFTIKKQYPRLAFVLHPDKNRFPGAEAAIKVIVEVEANLVLSHPVTRYSFDRRSSFSNPSFTKQYKVRRNIQSSSHDKFFDLNQYQATGSNLTAGMRDSELDCFRFVPRSIRQSKHISYIEIDDDNDFAIPPKRSRGSGDSKEKQDDTLDTDDLKCGDGNTLSFPTDADNVMSKMTQMGPLYFSTELMSNNFLFSETP